GMHPGVQTSQVHTSDGELTVTLTRRTGADIAVVRTPDGDLSGPDHLVDIAASAPLGKGVNADHNDGNQSPARGRAQQRVPENDRAAAEAAPGVTVPVGAGE